MALLTHLLCLYNIMEWDPRKSPIIRYMYFSPHLVIDMKTFFIQSKWSGRLMVFILIWMISYLDFFCLLMNL